MCIRDSGKVIIPYNASLKIGYYVVRADDKVDNLLCFETSEDLGLIKSTCELTQTPDLLEDNSDLFSSLNRLPGRYSIELDPTVKPVIAPRRRFAHSVLPRLRETLYLMEKMKVIDRVTKPTDWVSNIIAVEKHNKRHDFRICLDPKYLNKAIKIPKYL